MNLKVGIVGLPNAGKSTLFNALLKKQVAQMANYPFTTIEPNVGVVPVPDERLLKLAKITKEEEKMDKLPPLVPAVVEFVDIAGLVKGASQGEGLGNKFLSHIREVDLVVNVLREFEDASVVHVAGNVDPARDKDIIQTELLLADLQTLTKIKTQNAVTKKLMDALNRGTPAREVSLSDEEKRAARDFQLLSAKPVLLVYNVDEQHVNDSAPLRICAKTEAELAELSQEEQKAYLKELGLEASGLDRLIQKAYEMLGLISFLTCGVIEVRAWTITRGMKAPQAAGVIHTDFEKKFIKADVVSFPEFIGWRKGREEGKVRSEGREYVIEDGDVVEFKIGA